MMTATQIAAASAANAAYIIAEDARHTVLAAAYAVAQAADVYAGGLARLAAKTAYSNPNAYAAAYAAANDAYTAANALWSAADAAYTAGQAIL